MQGMFTIQVLEKMRLLLHIMDFTGFIRISCTMHDTTKIGTAIQTSKSKSKSISDLSLERTTHKQRGFMCIQVTCKHEN